MATFWDPAARQPIPSTLEQILGEFLVRHGRSAQLLEYAPYMLGIASMLVWFVRGLLGDCGRAFRYYARRRNLRLVGERGAPPVDPFRIRS